MVDRGIEYGNANDSGQNRRDDMLFLFPNHRERFNEEPIRRDLELRSSERARRFRAVRNRYNEPNVEMVINGETQGWLSNPDSRSTGKSQRLYR